MTGGFNSGTAAAFIGIYTHDVVFQHFRIRPGDATCNSGIQNAAFAHGNYNIVFDHLSVSWAQDENINLGFASYGVTLWRSISSEALYLVPGSRSCTGGGLSPGSGVGIASNARDIAIIQSIMAKNMQRNPQDGGYASVYINNLIYGWTSHGMRITNDYIGTGFTYAWEHSAVGNMFVVGPYTNEPGFGATLFSYLANNDFPERPGNAIYRSDNQVDSSSHPGTHIMKEYSNLSYNPNVDSPPEDAPLVDGLTIMPAVEVESFTKINAGARPMDRDTVDLRLMDEITARNGLRPSKVSDVGGYPFLQNRIQRYTVPSDPFQVAPGQSFRTNLEMDLEARAIMLEPQ